MTGRADVTVDDAESQDAAEPAVRPLPRGLKRRLARQLTIEIGPTLIFFLAFMASDIYWAAAVYAAATLAALTLSWAKQRRIPILPFISSALVVIFAALTIALDDATFIKVKPTVVNGFFATVIGFGWLFGFRLIERVLQPEASLDEPGLRRLTFRLCLYLLLLALANEVAWRTLSTEGWVLFKVFGLIVLNIAFAAGQIPLLKRHLIPYGELQAKVTA